MWYVNGEKTKILSAHQEESVDLDKKVQPGTSGFCPYFCAVDHPLCDVWMEKTLKFLLLADQKEGVDLDKKSTAWH